MDIQVFFRALKHRNYRMFCIGQSISLIGTWMQYVAVSWLVYRLTQSAFLLGVVGFINQVPMLVLTPISGVLADRWNRYRMLIFVQSGMMVFAAILAVLALTHWITLWHIIVLGLCFGASNALDAPTRHSFIVQLVENRHDLGNAIALNSAMFNSARLIGPAVAGLLISWTGEGVCFLLISLSFLAVIAALLAMKIPPQTLTASAQEGILKELKEGFLYTFGSKPIRLILLHFAFAALMGMSFTVLLPILANDILKGGSRGLGFLMGAMGIGALLSSILMANRQGTEGLWKFAGRSSTIFGVGLLALSHSRNFTLSLVIMVITGFGMINIMTASNTFLQTNIEDSKRARVMAFYLLAFFGTVPFGNLVTGTVAEIIGVPNMIMAAGIFSLVGSWVFLYKFRSYLREAS